MEDKKYTNFFVNLLLILDLQSKSTYFFFNVEKIKSVIFFFILFSCSADILATIVNSDNSYICNQIYKREVIM